METCADCGKPIEMGQPSYYKKQLGADIGQSFHSHCGDPTGLKASEQRIRNEERERCAKIVETEYARVIACQTPNPDPMGMDATVNLNLRMAAMLLPDIAKRIRG